VPVETAFQKKSLIWGLLSRVWWQSCGDESPGHPSAGHVMPGAGGTSSSLGRGAGVTLVRTGEKGGWR